MLVLSHLELNIISNFLLFSYSVDLFQLSYFEQLHVYFKAKNDVNLHLAIVIYMYTL